MVAIDYSRILLPPDFQNHWNEKMGDVEYHSLENFLGSSSAKQMLTSAATFHSYFYLGNRMKPTKAMIIGTRVHMALLEPALFKKRLIVMPNFGDMKKKANQIAQAEWLLDKPKGSVTVTQEELDQVLGIVEAIRLHDQGFSLIKDGRTEIAGFVRCPITGIGIKFKPDFLAFDLTRFSDYKTTKSSKKRNFMKDVYGDDYRYDFQLAWYLYGIKLLTGKRPDIVSILASEKKPPYEPAAFYFTEFDLERAEAQVIEVLKKIRACIDSGKWPFRQQEIERARAPKFVEYDDADDEGEQ